MTPAELDELKSRPGNSCAEVAARYVRLRPYGRGFIGPCPICSQDGQDKAATRFEIKAGSEGWVCAVCNDGGDVIKLVQQIQGIGFRAAVEWLGGARQVDVAETEQRERAKAAEQAKKDEASDRYRQRERKWLYGIWVSAADPRGTIVEAYAANRGLPLPPWPHGAARLRYVADMPYFHGEQVDDVGRKSPRIIHRGPAMTAPIVRHGKFSGLHITYFDNGGVKLRICDPETGAALPAKKVRGGKSGGHIELIKVTPPAEPLRIVIGEGIETVLSVWHAMKECGIGLETTEFRSSVDLGNLGGKASAQVIHPVMTDARGRARRVPGPDPDLSSPSIALPDSVTDVTILGDGDSDKVTTECAIHRGAVRFRAARADRVVRAVMAVEGLDFNDMLRAGNG